MIALPAFLTSRCYWQRGVLEFGGGHVDSSRRAPGPCLPSWSCGLRSGQSLTDRHPHGSVPNVFSHCCGNQLALSPSSPGGIPQSTGSARKSAQSRGSRAIKSLFICRTLGCFRVRPPRPAPIRAWPVMPGWPVHNLGQLRRVRTRRSGSAGRRGQTWHPRY